MVMPRIRKEKVSEADFRKWYAKYAQRLKLNPDPDDPKHYYDYRAAYATSASPDSTGHWPSKFKKKGHPRLFIGGINTKTGKPKKK